MILRLHVTIHVIKYFPGWNRIISFHFLSQFQNQIIYLIFYHQMVSIMSPQLVYSWTIPVQNQFHCGINEQYLTCCVAHGWCRIIYRHIISFPSHDLIEKNWRKAPFLFSFTIPYRGAFHEIQKGKSNNHTATDHRNESISLWNRYFLHHFHF